MDRLIEKFNDIWGTNPDKWNWGYISIYHKLSEEFIREFKNKIIWNNISIYQKLNEEFIKEFKDKINWNGISYSQKLSEEFIKEFKDKINFQWLIQNDYCPPRIRIEYMRENGLIVKEDPKKHIIEYEYEEPKKVSQRIVLELL